MSSGKRVELQVDLVEKVTKQIITLSSGIIVVLVTILGYYLENFSNQPISWPWTIFYASICFLISIFLGLIVYGSLIGSIHERNKLEDVDIYNTPLKYLAICQWITFAIGILFLIISLYQISSVLAI